MSLRLEQAVNVQGSPVGVAADSGRTRMDAHHADRPGQSRGRRFRNQNERLLQMMTEQHALVAACHTEIAALKETVAGLAESLRLKDRRTLSVAEAARYAGVEPATIRRWLFDGKLKGVKRGGQQQSHWTVRRRDLDILLERNVNQTSAIEQEHT